jgi:hypothetical protein
VDVDRIGVLSRHFLSSQFALTFARLLPTFLTARFTAFFERTIWLVTSCASLPWRRPRGWWAREPRFYNRMSSGLGALTRRALGNIPMFDLAAA